MTSDHEGLPMILLEAMALRTPVIAHAVGGIPILLDQGACGVLVHEHNASGYGDEIYKLAHNPEMRSNIQKNALARVSTHYSAEKNADAYLLEYRELTS
jgi:glycosyltransferase involved in cell wall biosynthesis